MTLHILQTELYKITEGYKLIISSKSFQVAENLPLSGPASKKGFNLSQRAHKHTHPVSWGTWKDLESINSNWLIHKAMNPSL